MDTNSSAHIKLNGNASDERFEGRGLAVSRCAESNGQSTSGLKMEPKCIATIQTTEQGNPQASLMEKQKSTLIDYK